MYIYVYIYIYTYTYIHIRVYNMSDLDIIYIHTSIGVQGNTAHKCPSELHL